MVLTVGFISFVRDLWSTVLKTLQSISYYMYKFEIPTRIKQRVNKVRLNHYGKSTGLPWNTTAWQMLCTLEDGLWTPNELYHNQSKPEFGKFHIWYSTAKITGNLFVWIAHLIYWTMFKYDQYQSYVYSIWGLVTNILAPRLGPRIEFPIQWLQD